MKKLLAFILALAMVLSVAGCGKQEEPTTEAPTEAQTEAPTEKPTEAPTEAPTEPPEPVLEDPNHELWTAHGQYLLPDGTENGWNGKDSEVYEAFALTAIKLSDVEAIDKDLFAALSEKDVKYLYTIDLLFGTNDAGWTTDCLIDGKLHHANGSYAFKIAQCTVDIDGSNKVYAEDQWISDPKTAHAESLTPATLFMPVWQEEADENGFSWASNPVVIGGAGVYTLVIAQYANASSPENAGFGIGLILKEAKDGNAYEEVLEFIPADHTFGIVGSFEGSNWGEGEDIKMEGADGVYTGEVELKAGDEFKVRADSDWTYSWGDGADNLKCEEDGTYVVTITFEDGNATVTAEAKAPAGDAQSVLDAALTNLENVFRSVGDEEKARQLSFNGTASGGLIVSFSMGDQSMDLPVKASGSGEGVIDTAKGFHTLAKFEADLGMLAALIGGLNDDEAESDGIIKGTKEYYADFTEKKLYEEEDGIWYYSAIEGLEDPMDEDEHLAGKIQLDETFESYEFGTMGDHYVIEGKLKTQLPEGTEEMLPDSASAIASLINMEDLDVTCRITISKDMELTGIYLEMGELTADLSELAEGTKLVLEGIKADIVLTWDEGSYELPAEVAENAVEKPEEEDIGGEEGEEADLPWITNEFTLKDEVLADTDDFTLTAASVEAEKDGSVIVTFEAENKSDKDLTFEVSDTVINNYLANDYGYEDIPAGKKKSFELELYSGALETIAPEFIDEVRFVATVTETDNEETDPLYKEWLTIYPLGGTAEEVRIPERRTYEEECVVLDNDDVTFIVLRSGVNELLGFQVFCYVENKTDKDLMFDFETFKLNGLEAPETMYWLVIIPAGTQGYTNRFIFDNILEELEITAVETIEAEVSVTEYSEEEEQEPLHTAEMLFTVPAED